MWDLAAICQAVAGALRAEADRLDEEQSPRGLDALDELALHPFIRDALAGAGFGALAEQRYPEARSRRRRSEGDRCDIVLTERQGEHLLDPLSAGTLFADRGVAVDDALWIEVKIVQQFAVLDAAGPNPAIRRSCSAAPRPMRKLAASAGLEEGRIAHAALLLVLFTRDEQTARHDLDVWMHRCLDKGVMISSPEVESFAMTDRIGNGACAVAVVRVRAGLARSDVIAPVT